MASAIIGGLTSQGHPASQIEVVEPWDQARAALRERFGIEAAAAPGPQLARAALIVWAVKPQTFKEAALAAAPHTGAALHLSVAAGITTASIAAWLGSERIIRAMPNTPSSSSQYVLAAIKYIQFNYSHDISVDDIAKAVGVSRSHLYRVFMSNVGQSPIDYLTGYRISEACSLLKNTGLSIAEIAVSVGFFDQFYFSRVFKRAKGMPPSKYIAAQSENADAPASEEA